MTSTETAPRPSPDTSADPSAGNSPGGAVENAGSALLVRNESEPAEAETPVTLDSPLAGLPVQLDVTVPIPSFRVQDLLALEKGAVLETHWIHDEDVPVWCGGVQLAWTEFEVVDKKLAVRITRIS
jgi:flagellar motor switch protein FliN